MPWGGYPPYGPRPRDYDDAPIRGQPFEDSHLAGTDGDTTMNEAPQTRTAAAAGGGGGSGGGSTKTAVGSHETPITRALPSIGFRNTETAILPFDFYMSLSNKTLNTKRISSNFEISLTSPKHPIQASVSHILENDNSVITTGWADRPIVEPNQLNWINNVGFFPEQYDPAGPAAWWNWWTKMYDSYTTLGCSWEISAQNVGFYGRQDAIIVWDVDTSSATDTTNRFPYGTLEDTARWKDFGNYKIVPGCFNNRDTAYFPVLDYYKPETFGGHYKPYQKNHIVQNDQDTKTWNKVTEEPALYERLRLFIYSTPHSLQEGLQMNFHIRMKFIVQFKDLKNQLKYPINAQSEATRISLTNITDTAQATLAHAP